MRNLQNKIDSANQEALRRLTSARLFWTEWGKVQDLVPGMCKEIILRAGPPLPFKELTTTQQQGAVNGVLAEGLAEDPAEARAQILSGRVRVCSANEFGVCCSGTGIITASMTVNQVEEKSTGTRGFCVPFEGPNRGGMAGYGKYTPEIAVYHKKMRTLVAPVFNRILHSCGGIELNPFLSRGLAMGDELHIRQDAATALMTEELLFRLAETPCSPEERAAASEYLKISPRFFHPLDMASGMALAASIRDIPYSTIVCGQCGNGVTYGIRLSGLGGEWFTAPAPEIGNRTAVPGKVLPWIGDSCICEAAGWGAFASAASPLAAAASGQTVSEALALTLELYRICAGENTLYPIPALDGRGTPCCIDAQKVLFEEILPALHGGRMAPDGTRSGGGLARIPRQCFELAMKRFHEKYGEI